MTPPNQHPKKTGQPNHRWIPKKIRQRGCRQRCNKRRKRGYPEHQSHDEPRHARCQSYPERQRQKSSKVSCNTFPPFEAQNDWEQMTEKCCAAGKLCRVFTDKKPRRQNSYGTFARIKDERKKSGSLVAGPQNICRADVSRPYLP